MFLSFRASACYSLSKPPSGILLRVLMLVVEMASLESGALEIELLMVSKSLLGASGMTTRLQPCAG